MLCYKRWILIYTSIFSGLCIKHPEPYFGRLIGRLKNFAHNIRGTAYAVDESTIFIKNFCYDGRGPDAYFWVGNSPRPSPEGILIPYPEDYVGSSPPVLQAHNNTDVILRLPMGKRIRDIKWLSVWCRRFTVDFGEVFVPSRLEVPRPRVLPEFKRLAHGLRSDNVTILDAKTFYIPNLHYDGGGGEDAYFWVGNGTEPTAYGLKVPNEMGSLEALRSYQGEDIEIQLPGRLTVYDVDWLAVWSVRSRHNFGHVLIPKDLDVPPALGQTKISPPWWYNPTSSTARTLANPESMNCKSMMDNRLQVRWKIVNDSVEITLLAALREDQYVAFGLSGNENESQMIGGDVTVAFYDAASQRFRAVDYYMSEASPCDGKTGVCPDERLGGRNDVQLIAASREDGVTSVTFRRAFQTNEAINDRPIPRGVARVIAAFGPLNGRGEADAHDTSDRSDVRIDFHASGQDDCVGAVAARAHSWSPNSIIGENVFTARIGPAGGARGYTALTGQPSWGIAWYINDLLIPELTVERGQTYTFIVEGGDDRTDAGRYHPLYVTSSPDGGFLQKTLQQQSREVVYAGVAYAEDGYPYPTATGRLCEWRSAEARRDDAETFQEFFTTLRLECEPGNDAVLNWTVPDEAPDLLYYQCYSHTNLGWKIHVVDAGYISEHQGNDTSATETSPNSPHFLLSLLNYLLIMLQWLLCRTI